MATKRKIARVKLTQRPDALTGGEAIIAEATALESGAGLLIKIAAPRDGKVLYIQPYRADREVYLEIRSHALDCALGGRGRGLEQRDTDAERCDCGAALVYDPERFEWRPTTRNAEDAVSLLAVRLDNHRIGAGPATVVAHVASAAEYNALVTDRDGARDPRMRLWVGAAPVGARVQTKLITEVLPE